MSIEIYLQVNMLQLTTRIALVMWLSEEVPDPAVVSRFTTGVVCLSYKKKSQPCEKKKR